MIRVLVQNKICKSCHIDKDINEFRPRNRGICRLCHNIIKKKYNRLYYKQNYMKYRNAVILKKRIWRNNHKDITSHQNKYYYDENKNVILARCCKNNITMRNKVIDYYGGKCARCNESDYEFLVIDHINGGGTQHMIELRKNGINHYKYYKLLYDIKPSGFQVLCANCNWIKYVESMIPSQSKASKYYRKLKNKVFNTYGNKCACCDFNDIRALTIDHINGGGKKHKREIGNIYKWLYRNNCPSGYQILCFNCNMSKFTNKLCKHQESK